MHIAGMLSALVPCKSYQRELRVHRVYPARPHNRPDHEDNGDEDDDVDDDYNNGDHDDGDFIIMITLPKLTTQSP